MSYLNTKLLERTWTIKESGVLIEFPNMEAALEYVRGYASQKLDEKFSLSLTPKMKRQLRIASELSGLYISEIVRLGIAAAMKRVPQGKKGTKS